MNCSGSADGLRSCTELLAQIALTARYTPNRRISSVQMTYEQHFFPYPNSIPCTCSRGGAAHCGRPAHILQVQQRWYILLQSLVPSPMGTRQPSGTYLFFSRGAVGTVDSVHRVIWPRASPFCEHSQSERLKADKTFAGSAFNSACGSSFCPLMLPGWLYCCGITTMCSGRGCRYTL